MKPAIIAVAALLLLTACGGTAQQSNSGRPGHPSVSTPMPSMPTPASTAPGGTPAAAIATDQVTISNFAFSPASITVKLGTTVTWTNQDQDAHTVTFKSGPDGGQGSQPLQMGDTYKHTFGTAGTIGYICSIHPFMKGTVLVTP